MQYKNVLAGAAVLLASAQTALAVGSATVVNNCANPMYYASVGQSYSATMQPIEGSYTEAFSQEGVGISIKLSPNDSLEGAISQFEFTWTGESGVFYDLSNINGDISAEFGVSIVPSMQNDPAHPTCVPVECPAGQAVCTAAYNAPDDTDTKVCSQDANLVLTLCPGGSAKRSVEVTQHAHNRVHARHLPRA